MCILGDSVFVNNTRITNGKIIKGSQSNDTKNVQESPALAAVENLLPHITLSERRCAEWVVSATNGSFARLESTTFL